MEELFRLKYEGETIRRGEMDAHAVAEAIAGFADFIERIGDTTFGQEAELRTSVRGFREGSFEIAILLQHVGEAAVLLAPVIGEVSTLLEHVKGCIEMLKHLEGKAPESIKQVGDGNVLVENNNGIVQNVHIDTLNLVLDPTVGRAAEKFVRRPLKGSAETIKLYANDDKVAEASRDEADSFTAIASGEVLTENVAEVWLRIRTVHLHGEAQWKFFDGRTTFPAPIEDEDFRQRVEVGRERFGSGDELLVRLRSTQKRVRGEMKAEYVVEKVLEHRRAGGEQGKLL